MHKSITFRDVETKTKKPNRSTVRPEELSIVMDDIQYYDAQTHVVSCSKPQHGPADKYSLLLSGASYPYVDQPFQTLTDLI